MAGQEKISIKAVIFGAGIDIALTFISGIILAVVIIAAMSIKGVPLDQFESEIEQPVFMILGMFIGMVCTFMGALAAGFIAKRAQVVHGLLVGLIAILIGLLTAFTSPFWYNVVAFILVLPVAALGGWVSKLFQNDKDKQNKTEEHTEYTDSPYHS